MIYIVTLSFEMIAFLDVISLMIKCAILVWGAFILFYNFIETGLFMKIRYRLSIFGFILVGIITSLWNMSPDFLPNLVFVYHSIICFFIFYGMYIERSRSRIEHEMLLMLRFFIFFSAVFSVVSIMILIFRAQVNIGPYYLGIFGNRLIGIYTNSNLLAFSMIVSIVSCDIMNDKYVKEKFKDISIPSWVIALCVFLNCISLFLSDSNASFLFLVIYAIVRIFYNKFSGYIGVNSKKFMRNGIILIICSMVLIIGSFVVRLTCQDFVSIIINDVHKIEEPITDDAPNLPLIPSPQNTYIPDLTIGREHYDVSSGRVTLFKQGLKIFRINPIIGIGRANLVRYGEKYISGGLIFSDLHNSYLTILVSYGLLGFSFFACFSVLVAFDMCKRLFEYPKREQAGVFSKLFSILVAYCAYSLLEKAILSEITFMVVFFWLILGYTVLYLQDSSG